MCSIPKTCNTRHRSKYLAHKVYDVSPVQPVSGGGLLRLFGEKVRRARQCKHSLDNRFHAPVTGVDEVVVCFTEKEAVLSNVDDQITVGTRLKPLVKKQVPEHVAAIEGGHRIYSKTKKEREE